MLWSSGLVEGSRQMRMPRRIVVAFGVCGLTAAALVAAGTGVNLSGSVAAGAATTGSVSQALSAPAGVTVQPGVMHLGRAQSSPPTTADCEKAYKVACLDRAARVHTRGDGGPGGMASKGEGRHHCQHAQGH